MTYKVILKRRYITYICWILLCHDRSFEKGGHGHLLLMLAPVPQTRCLHFYSCILKQPQPFQRPIGQGTRQSPCHSLLTGNWEWVVPDVFP